jgi:hypothetical protein
MALFILGFFWVILEVFILEVFVLEVLDLEVLVIVHTREDVGNDLGILVPTIALTLVIIRTPTMSLTPSLVVIPITINIILAFMLPIGRSMAFIRSTFIITASPVTFVIFLVILALIHPAGGIVTTTTTI